MEGKKPRVTAFRPEHIPETVAIEETCIPSPWAAASFESELALTGGRSWILELDGSVLGYIIIRCAGTEAELMRIAVAAGARRRGYARQLLMTAVERISEEGVQRLYLEVRISNAAARHFYERNGFQVTGIRPRYYSNPEEDAVLMNLNVR